MKIIKSFNELQIKDFNNNCTIIIAKYNSGKSSICTNHIYKLLGREIIYVTFTNQNKPHFKARKNQLNFNEIIKNKIIIFDEISDDLDRDIESYIRELIKYNKLIILSNYLGDTNNKKLFNTHYKNILSKDTKYIQL